MSFRAIAWCYIMINVTCIILDAGGLLGLREMYSFGWNVYDFVLGILPLTAFILFVVGIIAVIKLQRARRSVWWWIGLYAAMWNVLACFSPDVRTAAAGHRPSAISMAVIIEPPAFSVMSQEPSLGKSWVAVAEL